MKFLQVIPNQDLGDLNRIQGGALAPVVRNDPEINPIEHGIILTMTLFPH